MPRLLFFVLCISMLHMACKNNTSTTADDRKNGYTVSLKTKEDSLFYDVMEGHDAGMAKVGKLRRYISALQHRIDSLQNTSAKNAHSAYFQTLKQMQQQLLAADSSMNAWMDGFKPDSAAGKTNQRVQYLQSEKEKVALVKEQILTVLNKADSVLGRQ